MALEHCNEGMKVWLPGQKGKDSISFSGRGNWKPFFKSNARIGALKTKSI
jgi:hypothetical protein